MLEYGWIGFFLSWKQHNDISNDTNQRALIFFVPRSGLNLSHQELALILSDLVTCLLAGWWLEWVSSPCTWCPWFSGQTCCFSWEQRLLSLLSNDAPTVWEAERIDLPNLQVRWPPVKVPFHAHVHWQCYWRNAVSGTCYNVTMLRPTVKVVSLHKHMQIVTAGRSEWNVLRCYDVTTFCMFPLRSMSRT